MELRRGIKKKRKIDVGTAGQDAILPYTSMKNNCPGELKF
jgi:hypothetical protein